MLKCIDCGRPIWKKTRKGRFPKRCESCRKRNADKWREQNKEKK